MAERGDDDRRVKIVEQHIRYENAHDLDGVMSTFGAEARYDDEPWADRRVGIEAVRGYYADLLRALPDLTIDVIRRHVATNAVVLEVMIRGTHAGEWRRLPPTGRRVEIPLCGVFTFDADDRLAGERIYYDRALVLRQLGVFHEPFTAVGRVLTVLTHPVTIAAACLRAMRPRPRG